MPCHNADDVMGDDGIPNMNSTAQIFYLNEKREEKNMRKTISQH